MMLRINTILELETYLAHDLHLYFQLDDGDDGECTVKNDCVVVE